MNNSKYDFKAYNNEIYAKTKKYQKIYGFETDKGKEATHNNEADAFKHTFMQADLALKSTIGLSKLAGDIHEWQGDMNNQPKGEKNMDLWNNEIGREISKEIRREYNRIEVVQHINSGKMDDIIADKIMQRMRKGELITHPSDPRKYRTPAQKLSDDIKNRYHKMQEERNNKYPIFRSKNSSQNNSSGNGRWVTINGKHVYLD